MDQLLVPILFGWPAIIASLVISLAGLVLRKPWLLVVGGVMAIPFSWYLSGYPAIRTLAIIVPIFQFISAWSLKHEKKILAWLLLCPFAAIIVILAIVVLTQ